MVCVMLWSRVLVACIYEGIESCCLLECIVCRFGVLLYCSVICPILLSVGFIM